MKHIGLEDLARSDREALVERAASSVRGRFVPTERTRGFSVSSASLVVTMGVLLLTAPITWSASVGLEAGPASADGIGASSPRFAMRTHGRDGPQRDDSPDDLKAMLAEDDEDLIRRL